MKILIIGSEDAYKYSKNMFLMQKIEEYTKEHPECNIEVVYDELSPVISVKENSKVNKPYYRKKERW